MTTKNGNSALQLATKLSGFHAMALKIACVLEELDLARSGVIDVKHNLDDAEEAQKALDGLTVARDYLQRSKDRCNEETGRLRSQLHDLG
ncbi:MULTISPECIES: hypothetical protein [Enterobacterales]|uniref:hypothetical protein n=1 Tax=Enterobacterales TaxID=91347 RepID=UPI002ED99643